MYKYLESIITAIIQIEEEKSSLSVFDSTDVSDCDNDELNLIRSINAAFLTALSGFHNEGSELAAELLNQVEESRQWGEIGKFYKRGIKLVRDEIQRVCESDQAFEENMKDLTEWLSDDEQLKDSDTTREKIWSVFFPEANGIIKDRNAMIEALRKKRSVSITKLNDSPVNEPAEQLLFTSNALLTVPPPSKTISELNVADSLKEKLKKVINEPQVYWYDHPIQVGVETEGNEVVYGLKGFEEAVRYEVEQGNVSSDTKATCLLSVSVTHQGLHGIAKNYLEEELKKSGDFDHVNAYVFTESDTQRIIDEILLPAASYYLSNNDAEELLNVFGVDGEYGRHYSFLKAVSALWKILIDPEIKGTFKIDLDQIFPQKELSEQVGATAFELFKTPLWGAEGVDSAGKELDLGMIAGALVNESDIGISLFTPDVRFPEEDRSPDEAVFYSSLPQALSTEAEMMTRYSHDGIDGINQCIQRIHVTGGTNGILVDSLRYHRPFTPSFIGRAEDQAYILSILHKPEDRLAYVHKDGLIMRHDKKAFAQEAIRSSHVAKLVGDYIRILYFSAYAGVLPGDKTMIKEAVDPFTGCFISRVPVTVVYLRFALKAVSLFSSGQEEQGLEFVKTGAGRIMNALEFINGKNSRLKAQYEKERKGWDLYYDTLDAIEDGLNSDDVFAMDLKKKAQEIVAGCSVQL